jgi:DNA-binding winged helix-turn-helix (wHTH) protein
MHEDRAEDRGVAEGFRLGEWEVYPTLNQMVKGALVRQVEPKAMDLLALLATRAGQVVRRPEILDQVWGRQFVSDSTLNRAISVLRKALDDDPRAPRLIGTVNRRGYRLMRAPVPVRPATPATGPTRSACFILVGEREVCLPPGETTIGRGHDVTLHIDSLKASRRHVRIVVDGTSATVEDLGSTNGTWVAGKRLRDRQVLADGDNIMVGDIVVTFRLDLSVLSTEEASAG